MSEFKKDYRGWYFLEEDKQLGVTFYYDPVNTTLVKLWDYPMPMQEKTVFFSMLPGKVAEGDLSEMRSSIRFGLAIVNREKPWAKYICAT
ncbi:hypothetical protein P8860_21805 [Bacillus spizizenii]|uniref:Uncharacterized protein n=1 Tax=Bacillus spizizenii TaxID=96241 RepID=A0A9Q4HA91_BACSC|nr:hypothetical protein [Bacillus spizizenii]MEC0581929.1 hypothetical protein [Bacillus spizizenii]MEC0631892.1 hypothetical protein [Bacillus spizizenii]